MKNKKTKFLLLCFSLTLFFLINPSQTSKKETAMTQESHQKEQIAKSTKQKDQMKRSPASIKKVTAPLYQKKNTNPIVDTREYIGKFKDISQLKFVNKISLDWEDRYKARFFNNIPEDQKIKNFKIEKKKSIVKVKNNSARNLEHIIVSFNKADGSPFAFEAMIDSDTGSMLHSWNKTHSENKNPVKLKVAPYAYKRERDF